MRRPRPRTKPQPAANALARALAEAGLEGPALHVELARRWSEVVGEAMARHTWPEACREGSLVIGTAHPAWRHEVHYRQEEILARLAVVLGQRLVHHLSSVVRPRDEPAPPPQVRPEAVRQGHAVAAASGLGEGPLKEALERAAAAHAEARRRRREP
jgi:hypothetical protein